jgi:hypothetical protein
VLDIGTLMSVTPRPETLQIVADDPWYMPVHVSLGVVDTHGRALAEPTDLRAEVRVQPAGAAVGTVTDEQGRPVAGAAVALIDPSSGEPIDHTTCNEDGSFRLRAGRDGEFDAVATMGHRWIPIDGEINLVRSELIPGPGLRPARERVALTIGDEVDVAPLVLRSGLTIAGCVVDERDRPVAGAVVEASTLGTGSFVSLEHYQLTYSVESVEHETVLDVSDQQGRFHLDGLVPGPYQVTLQRWPGLFCHQGVWKALARRVTAPARDVRIEASVARFAFEVVSEGVALPGASIQVGQRGGIAQMRADTKGSACVGVRPGETYDLEVSAPGYATHHFTVTAPDGGESRQVITLERPSAKAALQLTLLDPGGEMFDVAVIYLRPSGGFSVAHEVHGQDGRFAIEGIEPGDYRAEILPGSRPSRPAGYYRAPPLDVTLVAGSRVERTVRVQAAGRLRITARGENSILAARCTIRDAQGSPVRAVFCHAGDDGTWSVTGALIPNWPSDIEQAFEPGRYTIELSHEGYRPKVVEVTITAFETSDLEVTLERF